MVTDGFTTAFARMLEKILVAVDGSEFSKKALELATEIAERFDSRLHIVHVPQGSAADRVMVLGGASVMLHASREEIEQAGRSLIEAAQTYAEQRGAAATTELRAGDPAQEIIASAEDFGADCIVVGSRGLGDFGGLLLGSVSHKVNNNARCSCITVR